MAAALSVFDPVESLIFRDALIRAPPETDVTRQTAAST